MRVTHWLIALSILVLVGDGPLHRSPVHDRAWPGAAVVRHGLDEGDSLLHRHTCSSCAVIARLIWMFTGNKYARWDKFLSVHRARQQGHHADGAVLLVPSRQAARLRRPQPGGRVRLSPGVRAVSPGHRDGARDAWRRAPRPARRCDGSRRSRRSSADSRSRGGFITSSCGCCSASCCITSTARC